MFWLIIVTACVVGGDKCREFTLEQNFPSLLSCERAVNEAYSEILKRKDPWNSVSVKKVECKKSGK